MRGAPPPRIEEGAVMSVYTKDRAHTTFTPVDNAAKLMDEITLYVYKERYVPKKYRLTLGTDLIRKVDELYDNVTYANRIFITKIIKKTCRSGALTGIKRRQTVTSLTGNCSGSAL